MSNDQIADDDETLEMQRADVEAAARSERMLSGAWGKAWLAPATPVLRPSPLPLLPADPDALHDARGDLDD